MTVSMNILLELKHLKHISLPTRPVICKCLLIVIGLIVLRAIISPFLAISWSEKSFYESTTLDLFPGVRKDKFVEVPQIIWGLNNQKIAFVRACLTAKFLNRSLLMPSLSDVQTKITCSRSMISRTRILGTRLWDLCRSAAPAE
jgi:hypothetical protein